MRFASRAAALTVVLLAATLSGKAAPATPLRLVSADGTRPIPTVVVGDTELVSVDDLAAIFGVLVREDALARAITVAYKGRTIVVSQDQALASIAGRLVSLPAAPARIGGRWHLPVEFIGRALSVIYDVPLELRKASRLVIRGRMRVPRVVVRHEVAGNQARVTLDVAPPTPHQVSQDGSRLLVRFDADLLDATLPGAQSQWFVQNISVEQTTVVVDVGPRFASFRASDVSAGADTSRIVVDLFAAADQTAMPGVPAPAPALEATPLPLPTPGVRTIVIDPGHGGDEDGAKGARGTLEKTLTLSVARRLKSGLEARLGARVLLTREDDRTLPLDERAAFANNNKADVFVSLHANASLRHTATGAEVFYLSLDRADEQARLVAESEGVAMPVFGGGTREIDVILWEMAQTRHLAQSAELATAIEGQLRTSVPMSPRPIQQAPFRVLVGANMPAVLVELGYLTNAEQESALAAGPFQTRLARAITEAVARFFAAPPATPAVATSGGPQ
ncbi:MAG: N-acetylmuramoyl-L-alanine amidase [Vicinamibacteria bacterium]|nr:N-acetylmuramoyl-L-alanine amidase [Vicinamibacteria bacterium]